MLFCIQLKRCFSVIYLTIYFLTKKCENSEEKVHKNSYQREISVETDQTILKEKLKLMRTKFLQVIHSFYKELKYNFNKNFTIKFSYKVLILYIKQIRFITTSFLKTEQLCRRLETNTTTGLTKQQAKELLIKTGPNTLTPSTRTPEYIKFFKNLFHGEYFTYMCKLN